MRPVVQRVAALAASTTSIAALTTLGAAGFIPQNGSLATGQGVANAQTTAGAGLLVLNGALALNNAVGAMGFTGFAQPTKLNFQSTGNLSGITFTVVGFVAPGAELPSVIAGPVTETITGPNNATVTTLNTFSRVLSISASAAVGTNVTVFGTAVMGTNVAQQVSLTSANNLSGVNFTVYGYNANGQPFSEVLAGPNANTVNTVNYFASVSHITTNGAATAVSVGNTGVSVGPWAFMDRQAAAFGVSLQGIISGSPTWAVEYTLDDLTVYSPQPNALTHPVLTGQTTSNVGNIAFPVTGIRGKVTSSSGSFTLTAAQGKMF